MRRPRSRRSCSNMTSSFVACNAKLWWDVRRMSGHPPNDQSSREQRGPRTVESNRFVGCFAYITSWQSLAALWVTALNQTGIKLSVKPIQSNTVQRRRCGQATTTHVTKSKMTISSYCSVDLFDASMSKSVSNWMVYRRSIVLLQASTDEVYEPKLKRVLRHELLAVARLAVQRVPQIHANLGCG